ncbi:MAG: dihydroorotase [Oceanospirillaceae bacterium]|jgi:dihydroorotase
MNMIIRGARLIDPSKQLDKVTDLHIKDGRIEAIGDLTSITADSEVDAKGMILSPSFVDLLTYLRDLNQIQKGTIASETQAAASAGFTHLCASPDTQPCSDAGSVISMIKSKVVAARFCDLLPVAALTKDLKGTQLSNMEALACAGCIGFSNASNDISDNNVLLRCYEYAATFGLKVFVQAQDQQLGEGHMHAGPTATRMGLDGILVIAETLSISRHLQFMQHTGVSGHFNQITSAAGVALIRQAKAQGMNITADVGIAHLCFTDTAIEGYRSQYHVQPPLRDESDRKALLAGIKDGTLDAICSAHQPHESAAKCAPFAATATGMAVYDMLVPLVQGLVDAGELTWLLAIQALSFNSATITLSKAASLTVGEKANLTLIDPNHSWTLDSSSQISHGTNQALANQQLKARVKLTIKGGLTSYEM